MPLLSSSVVLFLSLSAYFMADSGTLDYPRAKIAVAASRQVVRRTKVRRTRCGDADVVRLVRPWGGKG